MFRIPGILLLLYVLHSVLSGAVYTKDGWRGVTVSRDQSAGRFWVVIVVYTVLGISLITVF